MKLRILFAFSLLGILLAAGCSFSHNSKYNGQDSLKTAASDSVSVLPANASTQDWNNVLDSSLQGAAAASEKIALLEQIIPGEDIARDFKKQIICIERLDSLAEHLSKPAERAKAWLKAGQFYRNVSCYELAEKILLKAQREAEAMGEKGEGIKAEILLARGQNFVDISDFVNAAQLLTEAGSYFMEKKDYTKLSKVYMAQTVAYQTQYVVFNQFAKKDEVMERENYYLDKLCKLYYKMDDSIAKADCLNALVNYAINNQDYEKAKIFLARLDSLSQSFNYTKGLIAYYGNSGIVAEKQGNIKEGMALQYKAYETARDAGNMAVATQALANAAFDAGKLDEYKLMRSYSLEGLQLAKEYNSSSQLWRFLDNLSVLAEQVDKNYKEALDYRNECVNVYMKLYSENNANQINQYSARFESLLKENKINELQLEAKVSLYKSHQQNQLIFFLVLAIVLLAIIFLYRYRLSKKQEQLAGQRIRQLEQEKQLVAIQAVLDGETQERARFARDLHDGLGSMLTGVRMNLLEMKKDTILAFADEKRFEQAMGLLDRSIHEMRRIAHHLLPDTLSRFGLKPAVSDFCSDLPSVQFAYYGDESRPDPKLEEMIYRSIHELVSNALKHAGANNILVQIIQESNRIAFTVQDDGCGFDPEIKTEGMGLQNIRTRVAAYNGSLNIDSKVGEGTEINVEIKLPAYPTNR